MSAHRCCLQLFTKTGVSGAGWTCRDYVYLLRYVNLIYYVNKPFIASFEVIWMNIFKKSNRKRGFSLIEVVIVVAVISILLAVAVPNIIAYYRELKLVELDDNARTIFMAAQNEISAILAADKDGVPDGTDGSCEYPTSTPVAGVTGGSVDFDYLSTDNVADADSLHKIVPAGSIESQLHGNNYVVEYNHETGAVHAVWYWENGTNFDYQKNYTLDPNNADKPHATKDARIKVPVGYYGGGDVDRIAVKQMPIPKLTLINAEELKLDINVLLSGTTGITNSDIKVDVTISDSEGHEKTIITGAGLDTSDANNPKGSLVLDTLKPDKYSKHEINPAGDTLTNIGNKFKDWVAGSDILPGDNITVSVKLYYDGTDRVLIPQVMSVATNSLFANVTADGTAEIAYGRHLQNLHDSGTHTGSGGEYCSGVLANTSITKAKQIRDINFTLTNADEPIKSWASTYGTLNFHPVNNPQLTEYDGDDCEIRNMNAGHYMYGGVFSYIKGGTYKKIVIVNPHIHAEGEVTDVNVNPAGGPALTAGALAGAVDGTVTIENCKVYNDSDPIKDAGTGVDGLFDLGFDLDDLMMYHDGTPINPGDPGWDDIVDNLYVERLRGLPHIGAPASGSNSGGLVGAVLEDGTLTITNSFASVINIGAKNVGGLIGTSSGNVTIEGSYSASYVFGNRNVAGLIGVVENPGSTTTTIRNSYAAGEIVSGYKAGFKGAGLLHYNGEAQATSKPANIDVSNSYAAVRYGGDGVNGQPRRSDETGSTSSVLKIVGYIYGTFKLDPQNYYVQQSGIEYGLDSQGQEIAGTGGEIVDKTAYSDYWTPSACGTKTSQSELATQVSGASWSTDPGTLENTHAYKLLSVTKDLKAYPYPMLNTMAHYGDWLEDAGGDAMMAYIEKYDDGSYGIYAAKASSADGTDATVVKNGLEPDKDKIVIDDFYRIVSPTELTGWKFKLDDDTTEYDLKEDSEHKTIESDGVTYYCYTLENANGWDSKVNYYHKIKFDDHELAFIYNPSFACEAFDVSEFVYPDGGGASEDVHTEMRRSKPEMDGHITIGTLTDTDVFIRSARQLANIQAYTNDTTIGSTAQGWAYDQLANIDFDQYEGTLSGGKTNAQTLMPAKLAAGSYFGHEKEIKNLYIGTATGGAGLFESVGTDGSLNDMRLVNVSVAGDGALATGGLVGILYGTVDNCGIYVESGTGVDVETNYKDTWTVTGSGTNGVGGLIGYISNNAEAISSFAAVQVDGTNVGGTATEPVGGFAGQIVAGGKVDKCYAGGFVEEDPTTSKLAYLADSANVTGGGNVGGFVGSAANGSQFAGINYSTASVCGPAGTVGLFAGSMDKPATGDWAIYAIASAFDSTTKLSTAPRDESDYMGGTAAGTPPKKTVTYNQTGNFPYASGLDEHHGDWIEFDIFGLYYDTVGSTTGYYANGGNVTGLDALASGTPGDKNYATDDGYMFVTVENLGDISIRVGEKSFPMKPVELNPTMEINGKTYKYKYEVPAEALNTPTANYYNAVSINGKMFYANFGVAGEIFDSVTDPNKPMAKSGIKYTTVDAGVTKTEELKDSASTGYTGVVVRSARQLANIGIRSNVGEYDATNTKVYTGEAVAIQEAKISQVLDIDYVKYAEATKYKNAAGDDVSKIPEAVVLDGSNDDANHTPITINGGGYYGNNYEIRNLVPGMVRQITITSGSSVSEALVESGLVGRITKGEIKDVTLINAKVENDAQKAVSASSSSSSGSTGGGSGSGGAGVHILDVSEEINNGNLKTTSYPATTKINLDGGYFTLINKSSSSSIAQSASDDVTWKYNGGEVYSSDSFISFGGKSSEKNSHISFKTSGAATVKVWWVQHEDSHNVLGGLKLYKTKVDASATNTNWTAPSGTVGTEYFTVFDISGSGTYYLGDKDTNGNKIFRVEVYEPAASSVDKNNSTPYSAPTPTPGPTTPIEPGKDKFPDGVDSDKFKARFGALAGAVNPVDKSDPDCVKIENCGVYVEPDSGTDTDAYTTAYNKYSVKNTGTTGFKEDTVGGLIGMATQGTTIEKSYAAVKVAGQFSVGGFAGHLKDVTVSNCYSGGHTEGGIYSTTDYNVTANNKKSGAAGGFVGTIEATDASTLIFNGVCYSTSSASCPADDKNTDEKGTVGNFAGLIKDSTGTWQGFTGANIYGIGTMNGDNRTDEREYLDRTVTMHAEKFTAISAKPYDMDTLVKEKTTKEPMNYPYQTWTGQEMHHGDWPMRYNLVYFELYKEAAGDYEDDYGHKLKNKDIILTGTDIINSEATYIGFYGVFPAAATGSGASGYRVVNTLRVDGYVYKSGYIVVSDADVTTMRLDINSYYADSSQRKAKGKEMTGEEKDNGYYDDKNVQQPTHTTVAQCDKKIDFRKYNIIVDEAGTIKPAEDIIGKFGYVLPDVTLNVAASKDFYMDTQINGQTYLFNPQFPYEAVNVDIEREVSGKWEIDYETIRVKHGINYVVRDENGKETLYPNKDFPNGDIGDPANPNDRAIIVRSALNLAALTRYSREASNGLVKNTIITNKFYQHMDIDYSEYEKNTIYDGNTKNRNPAQEKDAPTDSLGNPKFEYSTGLKDHGQAPAILDGGSYEGFNHEIRNLYLSNDSANNNFVGLFSKLENATVQNLKLKDINVTCDKYNGTIDVGTLAASVSNSTISNVTIDGVTVSLDDDDNGKNEKSEGNLFHGNNAYEAVGGAIGKINDTGIGKTSITNVTVIDPSITVTLETDKSNDKLKVGGVIGSADGNTFSYTSTATGADTRSVNITDSGVYLSKDAGGNLNKEFTKSGISVTGTVTGDYSGGFAGFLGKGVNVTKDYSAIRVEGVTYAGGFAGHIQGSHVEDCYSGGYVEAATGDYSTSEYNVTGETAGGFAGRIQVAYETSATGIGQPMAMYMTGVNYTTSSAKGTEHVGVFAGEATDEAAEALAEKMGGNAPVIYAGGTTSGTKNEEKHVKTGSAIPREDNKSGFDTEPYNASGDFPYKTNQKAHHGDWVDSPLNAAGYWEVEDGLLRLWYIPSDAADTPVELTEEGALGFGHDSRDAVGITESGYFVVSSDTTTTFDSITETKMDMTTADSLGKRIKDMLGGDSVAVQVYELHNGKIENQEWDVNGETFTVNPAYGKAVEYGDSTTTMGASATEAYEIRTVAQLQNMATAENTKFFKQTHDIVFDSTTAGSYTSVKDFKGHFDGGSYRILDTTKPVFDTLNGATVDNVIVYAPEGYTSKTISGNGGLAASSSGKVEISNTIVAGFTISSSSGNVGGIVGEVTSGELTISNSEATNKLTGTGSSSNVGGLVGYVGNGATLNVVKSYAGGTITAAKSAGGLVGAADDSTSSTAKVTYDNVYSYVDMTAVSSSNQKYGIGPQVDTDAKDTIGFWGGGVSNVNTDDHKLRKALLSLVDWSEDPGKTAAAEHTYIPMTPDGEVNGFTDRQSLATTNTYYKAFPFKAYVKDQNDDNAHYGDWPRGYDYAAVFYWEKEHIASVNSEGTQVERDEYHFYAYGAEYMEDGTVRGSEVIDNLCYDHHAKERAGIVDYGYGYFYPTRDLQGNSTGTFNISVNGSPSDSRKDVNNAFTDPSADLSDMKDELFKAFGLSDRAASYVVKVLKDEGTAFKRDEKWTLSNSDSASGFRKEFSSGLQMMVHPAFGAGIYSSDFVLGDNDHNLELTTPSQARTVQQFKNILLNNDQTNLDYVAMSHDIDFGNETAPYTPNSMKGAGNTDYYYGHLRAKLFNGNGYRIIDIKIEGDDATKGASLFTGIESGAEIENLIIYSPDGTGTITATSGPAAGFVANCRGYSSGEKTNRKLTLTNCVISGYTIKGTTEVGGLVGKGADTSSQVTITNCQAWVTLDGSTSATAIGGLVGSLKGNITDSYSGGSIINTKTDSKVGGIFGNGNGGTKAESCYTYMDLTGTDASDVNVYPIGYNGTITNCVYANDDDFYTGTANKSQATGKKFSEMVEDAKSAQKAENTYWPEEKTDYYGYVANEMGEYPLRAVASYEQDGRTIYVHYGDWPYNVRAAGIAAWEKVGGGYKVQIVGADFNGNKLYTSTGDLYGEKFCEEHHVDTNGTITEEVIDDSGYAVFSTNSALTVTATGLTTEVSSAGDKDGVIKAINEALGGLCLSGETKVYSNENTAGLVSSTATVSGTAGSGVKLYYNPGMSGVSYEAFGTEANPVPIRTVRQLDNIPDSGTSGKHFEQTHDLYGDPTGGTKYTSYTGAVDFAGTYDGQSYKILELDIVSTDSNANVGLFASSKAGKFNNIILYSPSRDVEISGTGIKNSDNNQNCLGVGGLIGKNLSHNTLVQNCVVAGYSIKGNQYVGGLIGYTYWSAEIKNSAAVNVISSNSSSLNVSAGGLVGYNADGLTITNCYAGGSVTGTVSDAGGLVGYNNPTRNIKLDMKNCFSYVDLTGVTGTVQPLVNNKDSSSTYYASDNIYYLDGVVDTTKVTPGTDQGTAKSYGDLKDSGKWGDLFDTDKTVTPTIERGEATKSYVTTGKDAGDKQSADGFTPVENQTTAIDGFPFPEVVREVNADGSYGDYVHFGMWPEEKVMTSKYPWGNGKIGVFMAFDSSSRFNNATSEAVAYMFDDDGVKHRLGTSSKGTTCGYLGLVIGNVDPAEKDELKSKLQVVYFQDGVTESSGSLTGTITYCYSYNGNDKITSLPNIGQFDGYTLYAVRTGDNHIASDLGAVAIAYDAHVPSSGSTTIPADNVVGWFNLTDLKAAKGSASGDPGMPEGPGFEGAMAPAGTEAIMPEKFKLPEPENIDENGDDGHTQVVGGRMSVAKVRRVR